MRGLYEIDTEMVSIIRQISNLKPSEAPCGLGATCTGIVCGYITFATEYLNDLDSEMGDARAYGDQIVTAAVAVYRRMVDGSLNRKKTCNVPSMYDLLIELGELAYPQAEPDDGE